MRMIKIIAIPAITFIALLAGIFIFRENWSLSHIPQQSILSPSGRYVATTFLGDEGMAPPYGEQVTIYEAWNPIGLYFSKEVFGGRCKPLSIRWQSDQALEVSCIDASDVEIKESRYKSVEITFNFGAVTISTQPVIPADVVGPRKNAVPQRG